MAPLALRVEPRAPASVALSGLGWTRRRVLMAGVVEDLPSGTTSNAIRRQGMRVGEPGAPGRGQTPDFFLTVRRGDEAPCLPQRRQRLRRKVPVLRPLPLAPRGQHGPSSLFVSLQTGLDVGPGLPSILSTGSGYLP